MRTIWFQKFAFVFRAIQLVVDTKQVVYDALNHSVDVWLRGDSPWVRRIIGISPAPQVGSLYHDAIWDFDARVWMGTDVVRTTESDHEQGTSILFGTPSLKAVRCSVDPGLSSRAAGWSSAFCIVAWHSGGYKWPTSNGWPMSSLPPVIK